jgi:hypothetical protein
LKRGVVIRNAIASCPKVLDGYNVLEPVLDSTLDRACAGLGKATTKGG